MSVRLASRLGVVAALAVPLQLGCSVTPVPEPPALDANKISVPPGPMTTSTMIPILGEARAAPPLASVEVTNLDTTEASVEATARRDGSFELAVSGDAGNELRFQAMVGSSRTPPLDFIIQGREIGPSERHPCVKVGPGYEAFAARDGSIEITIENSCAVPVTLDGARMRLGSGGFSLTTPLPVDLPSGTSATLWLDSQGGPSEDVLFIDVVVSGRSIRYPFSVFAP